MEEEFVDIIVANDLSNRSVLINGSLLSFTSTVKNGNANDVLSSETEKVVVTDMNGLKLSVEDIHNVSANILTRPGTVKLFTNINNASSTASQMVDIGLDDDKQDSDNSLIPETQSVIEGLMLKDDLPIYSETILAEEEQVITSDTGSYTFTLIEDTESSVDLASQPVPKKRGGWPKGRKRKLVPETKLPKGPLTGYILYLKAKRQYYKDNHPELSVAEVTKLLGNEWSRLPADEKCEYLERAAADKQRYKEELRAYKRSSAYKAFLSKKRLKSGSSTGLKELDVDEDATCDIDDDDMDDLFCKTCDIWFSSLHNKREHLYGKQHLQAVASDFQKHDLATKSETFSFSNLPAGTSLVDSSSDAFPVSLDQSSVDKSPVVQKLIETCAARDQEIALLKKQLEKFQTDNKQMKQEVEAMKKREVEMQHELDSVRGSGQLLYSQLSNIFINPGAVLIEEGDQTLKNGITVLDIDV